MSAEAIARVVADLRAGRVRRAKLLYASGGGSVAIERLADLISAQDGKVVDATAIYRRLVEQDRAVWLYEDHPCIAPPFERFDVCYVNEHGNSVVMSAFAHDYRGDWKLLGDTRDATEGLAEAVGSQPKGWEPAQPVVWERVRWVIDTFCWVGGRGKAGPVPTTGPVHLWRFAVYEDGQPADLHWVQLIDRPLEEWDMANLVLLGALNFMACRNVELVEPHRARPERRRIERTGVTVHELTVFPVGRTRRGGGGDAEGVGVPLTSVRGHFAEYGTNGKGLLFGRLAGRFWIPAHARGEREHGEHDSSYVLADDR